MNNGKQNGTIKKKEKLQTVSLSYAYTEGKSEERITPVTKFVVVPHTLKKNHNLVLLLNSLKQNTVLARFVVCCSRTIKENTRDKVKSATEKNKQSKKVIANKTRKTIVLLIVEENLHLHNPQNKHAQTQTQNHFSLIKMPLICGQNMMHSIEALFYFVKPFFII